MSERSDRYKGFLWGVDPWPDEAPPLEQLMQWEADGGCEALDGCWIETDGHCSHGEPSWMLALGLI